ncbi:hypothetical protein [Streptomyces monashensis]|uniref:Secreted protein n=1 Tax=Streptomyces monashensis TaxID=1678012 RepID=A0A1S2QHG7_9ACTN|nr:hypothetical protein [Streptomyces monashensis]OIK05609.1 hypothetical protein BIV23_11965 [Streptomyces monashensis]
MNESVNESAEPEASPAPAVPAPARRPVGRTVAVALLALAVVGGVGFTAVTVAGADRDPGKPVFAFPKASEGGGRGESLQNDQQGRDVSGLRGLLMPYEWGGSHGYAQGPDIGEFGPDVALDGREATALRKQEIHGLPPTTRRALDQVIDKEHIRGMAMRSYAPFNNEYGGLDKPFTLTFELVRMANRDSVRELSTGRNKFFDALGVFPRGPEIPGHKEAACFRMPRTGDAKIDRMVCSASVGDVLVTVNAAGTRPLDTDAIAVFVGRQLDRIKDKDPGKAV